MSFLVYFYFSVLKIGNENAITSFVAHALLTNFLIIDSLQLQCLVSVVVGEGGFGQLSRLRLALHFRDSLRCSFSCEITFGALNFAVLYNTTGKVSLFNVKDTDNAEQQTTDIRRNVFCAGSDQA